MQKIAVRALFGVLLLALAIPCAASAEAPKNQIPTLSERAHWELVGIYRPDFALTSTPRERNKRRRLSWKYDHPMQLAGSDVVLRLKASTKLRKAVRLELKF